MTLDLFDLAERVMRQNLRRKYPGASPAQIEDRLREWLRHRPGAEHGDGEGRPGTWPRSQG